MATVLITGGTGLVGAALTRSLSAKGHRILVLTRKARPPAGNAAYREWDVEKQTIDESAVREADYVVHLAGANVAEKRWTEKRKKEIVDSRVKSGGLLVKALTTVDNNVKAVVSASAIGWYGPDPQVPNPEPFAEGDAAADDFLGRTCVAWERSIAPVAQLNKRLVILRTGIVLSNEGGAYPAFKKPLAFGLAAILGTGRQTVSWIHVDDLVRQYTAAIENEAYSGVYNAVAPHPVPNRELVEAIRKQRRFSVPVHVPSAALKLALGEMSVEVLKSATVSAKKITAQGYRFVYPDVDKAVRNLEEK